MTDLFDTGRAGVVEEDLSFVRGSLTLRGVLALPETPPRPVRHAALTLHGWAGPGAGPHRLFVTLGRELAAAGVPTLRFDLSGRGMSDGEASAASLDHMIADTVAAIDCLRARTGAERVDLIGICSGGNVAIGAATLRSDSPGRLVCLSTLPFAPAPRSRARAKAWGYLRTYLCKACALSTWRRLVRGEVCLRGVGQTVGSALTADGADRRLKDSARDIPAAFTAWRRPVLFLYGGADPGASAARAHYEAFCEENGIPAAFGSVGGANHNFYSLAWAGEVRRRVAGFLLSERPEG